MPPDQEFLLYPLDTGEDPLCPRCHLPMLLAANEVRDGKPDFLTFRCEQCGRSEKFVCENDAAEPAGSRPTGFSLDCTVICLGQ
jgi:peptide subunit release factor 1 (eRF1)